MCSIRYYGDRVREILDLDIDKDLKTAVILTLLKPQPITSDDLQWGKDMADELLIQQK